MSLILAIPCSDRIVVAADSRTVDGETGATRPDTMKIFELTANSAILIAGAGLIDEISNYMHRLIAEVCAKGNQNIVDIARDVKAIIDRREWAEWKDEPAKSHIEVLVAGYDGGRPAVYAALDNREFSDVWAGVFGNWDGAKSYALNNLQIEPHRNTAKTAKKVAVEMLTQAEAANPSEIGGEYAIWHIYPDGVRPLQPCDVDRLRKKYAVT